MITHFLVITDEHFGTDHHFNDSHRLCHRCDNNLHSLSPCTNTDRVVCNFLSLVEIQGANPITIKVVWALIT